MHGSSVSNGKGKPRRQYYVCPNHLKKNGGTCSNKGIDASDIEHQVKKDVFNVINQYLKSNQVDISNFQASLVSKKRLKQSILKSIDNLQNKIDNSIDRLLEPEINDSKKIALEKKIEDNTNEIENLKQKMKLADEAI